MQKNTYPRDCSLWNKKKVNVESWRISPLFKGSKKLMETRKEQSELEKNPGRDVRDVVEEVGNGEYK